MKTKIVYKCGTCSADVIPKNEIADMLYSQGREVICDQCRREQQPDYATMPYKQYLETDKWKQKAHDCKVAAGWKCRICNDGPPLDAHHRTYKRRGYELPDDLTALCIRCHDLVKGLELY
jgi:DNA-directed RNA polymerase subunit RPC12/RpoP